MELSKKFDYPEFASRLDFLLPPFRRPMAKHRIQSVITPEPPLGESPARERVPRTRILTVFLLFWGFLCIDLSLSQDPSEIEIPPGVPGQIPMPPRDQPEGMPPDPSVEPGAMKKADPADKAPEVPTVKRPTSPDEPPDKREFDVRPDEDGMVQFQFRNQAWPDILKWVADVSNMTLDWQELPADFLNISTHRKYTLEETRDLINRHLLARGFTMLEFESTILVTKTKGINVSLVPKIDPTRLGLLPPNRFVRISIPLRSLVANDVLEELKVLISANGTLNSLSSTNRLEAMDSASNLLELLYVLQDEQSSEALDNLAREFELQYVRASDARDQLMSFLKLESSPPKTMPMSEEMDQIQQQMMMQQQQQQQQMMMQQQSQPEVLQPGKGKKDKEPVLLVANVRRNSLIVHATPDKMAMITTFIKRIDVPSASDNLNVLNTRMKVYRLAALDPKKLVASLLALDALEPTTKLEIDEKNKAIIAYASLSDQLVIQQTIQRLDGSAREFDVIQLRRLRAEDVAGTIRTLLGIDKDKKQTSQRRNYFFYDPFQSNNKKETEEDQLRVGANVQNNQLLIWANEMEREEIHKLLAKLGESPTSLQDRSRMRTIDANRSQDTLEYLKKLEGLWKRDSSNPLILPDESLFDPPDIRNPDGEPLDKDIPKPGLPQPAVPSPTDISKIDRRRDSIASRPFVRAILVQDGDDGNSKNVGKPIRMRFDADGNLVLESDDLEALDRLEQLMNDRSPPSRKHIVFAIKHARPSWIKLNLEDYFKEDKKEKQNDGRDMFFSYIFDLEPPEKEDDSPQLGKRRKLRFISDNDTKTLVVIGADSTQRETIARLIKLWDVPPLEDKRSLRYTNIVKVEHSKADSIVEAIKDAFRDLLSSNDKALERPSPDANKEKKREDSDGDVGAGGGMSFTFSGRLSLGVDRVTNSIIVSAKGEDLLDLVCKLIADLDEAAQPTGMVQSIQLNGANPSAIEKALKNIIRNEQKQSNEIRFLGQEAGNPNPSIPNASISPYNGRILQNNPGSDRDR